MFDDTDDTDTEEIGDTRARLALRAGLEALPTPDVSPDFDARIQMALRVRPRNRLYGWQTLWAAYRPAVPAGVCTLCAMLGLLYVTQALPPDKGMPATHANIAAGDKPLQQAAARGQDETWDDNMDLNHASLRFFLSRPIHRVKTPRG